MADITLEMIMNRLQTMHSTLQGSIDDVTNGVSSLSNRIDVLETNLTRQIDAIDARLDAIEIESLPRRVTALEKAVLHAS